MKYFLIEMSNDCRFSYSISIVIKMVLYSELMNSFNFHGIKTCNYLHIRMCVWWYWYILNVQHMVIIVWVRIFFCWRSPYISLQLRCQTPLKHHYPNPHPLKNPRSDGGILEREELSFLEKWRWQWLCAPDWVMKVVFHEW